MVKHIQKVHSVYGSVTQVKFGDKPFDMAVCNQVIEHTEDDEKVVENLSHSLKDKGILYISSIAREPGAWYIHAYNGEPRLSPMHIKEYADLDEFVALLKRHKFKILQARSKQFYLKWWNTPFHIGTGKLGVPIPKFKRIEALVQK
jgi:2-polyprenyl-3-methyl-5-hydroxy-6-metoxy-1,4-benzoquinol methylase